MNAFLVAPAILAADGHRRQKAEDAVNNASTELPMLAIGAKTHRIICQ